MRMKYQRRGRYLFLAVAYAFGLYFFYLKYVPLVPIFQAVLAPLLILVTVSTLFHFERGTLVFIFVFPLINSLPYIFRIYENIPQAPTALVLFLFYFWGILLRAGFVGLELKAKDPLFRVIKLFSLLIILSALITVFRYGNFFPFLADSIYELNTNTYGTSAGGAIMSTIFTMLNYLTSFAFFYLLLNLMRSDEVIEKIISAFSLSAFISLLVGSYQLIFDPEFGNNLIGQKMHLINGTFKDALSFSAFISLIMPLLLGSSFVFKGGRRWISLLTFFLAGLMIFITGSKIALVSVSIALCIFAFLSFRKRVETAESRRSLLKVVSSGVIIALLLTSVGFLIFTEKSRLPLPTTLSRFKEVFEDNSLSVFIFKRERLWKAALLMMRDYPLTGVGVGAYIIDLPNYSEVYSFPGSSPESSENYFIQIGVELGIGGFILAAWIFGIILVRLKRKLTDPSFKTARYFFLTGAAGGICAFLINTLYHSYIGSYEVNYSFWLLVAVILSLKNSQDHLPLKVGRKAFALWGMFFLLAYGGIHLWNSTHSLSLESRTEKLEIRQRFGFYQNETTPEGIKFNWTGRRAGRAIELLTPFLRFHLHASHPDITSNPVRVKIFLIKDFFREKRLLQELTLSNHDWNVCSCDVSAEVNQKAILLIEVSRTWNPKKTLNIPDSRDLGVAIGQIQFRKKS